MSTHSCSILSSERKERSRVRERGGGRGGFVGGLPEGAL